MHKSVNAVKRLVTISVFIGCSGNLTEKSGQSDIDAASRIPLPTCDQPAVPADGSDGTCSGPAGNNGSAGDDCLACHSESGPGTPFVFAGTLYTDITGRTVAPGATIYVEDTMGNAATAISRASGNFYTTDGFVTYPAYAFVSLCPTVLPMLNHVDTETGANCNTSMCHTSDFRVHL